MNSNAIEAAKTAVRLNKKQDMLIISRGDQTNFVSVNLVKHVLKIPYTKKNGEVVSLFDQELEGKVSDHNMFSKQVEILSQTHLNS